MTVIRRLNGFDYPKIKKLISYLCIDDGEKFAHTLFGETTGIVNAMLPLALKFKSESFILIKDSEISGLITIKTTAGNPCKINITHLIFKENDYETGKALVNFVVQKIGAKGAHTFVVSVDESHTELFDLFINGCGFRQCSSETLWKCENQPNIKSNLKFRYAVNSDADKISEFYNSEISTVFKPSLERVPKEFTEPFFGGFCNYYKSRFILEGDYNIQGYFSITTSDNINYIFDITTNSGYEFNYSDIIGAMLDIAGSKKHKFYPLVKQKKYTNESQRLEEYLKSENYKPIQTRHILVKDFYRPVSEKNASWKVFTLGENTISV